MRGKGVMGKRLVALLLAGVLGFCGGGKFYPPDRKRLDSIYRLVIYIVHGYHA